MNAEWVRSPAARRILVHWADARPAWLWSGDGSTLLWRNAAARFFNAKLKKYGLKLAPEPVPIKGQVARLIRLGSPGRSSLSRIRFLAGGRPVSTTCTVTPIELADGQKGALIVAVWYLIVDTAGGQPFHTPNALGKIFFRGDLTPSVRRIVPEVVLGYTVFHVIVFALIGMGLTLLVHLATRNIALRRGVWIGLVVAFGLFAGLTYMMGTATGERLSAWQAAGVGAALAGVALVSATT